LQAAVLQVKLPYLERWNAARQMHARQYTAQLQDVVATVPVERAWSTHVYYVYVVQVSRREQLRHSLEREGIATGVHYPTPIHLQPACSQYGYKQGMLPITERASERIVSLPMYAELTEQQIAHVIQSVKNNIVSRV